MKNGFQYTAILVLAFLVTGPCFGFEADVTTGTLFEEMIDLEGLTRVPEPFYKTVQFSSYDRRSKLAGGPDWFANSDGFGREPIPNFQEVLKEPGEDGIGEYLLADVEGPGAVVRLWSAAITGNLRFFLDGNRVYEGPAVDFFHQPFHQFKTIDEIDGRRLAETLYQRDASYTPFAFANQLRMEWIGDLKTLHFYQVQVRLFERGTGVQTFDPIDISTYRSVINRVTAILEDPNQNPLGPNQEVSIAKRLVDPGQSAVLYEQKNAGAIGVLTLRLDAGDLDLGLRQTVLQIIFDDHPWGQVQAPLGDFFGAAPGINPYQSLPFSVEPDGTMTSRFIMPFQSNVRIMVANHGKQIVRIGGAVTSIEYKWDDLRSMHFRARWRVDHDLIASNKEVQDLPFVVAQGEGVYVGTTSILMNPNPIPTPYGNWWGEGDEKVFVDNESFPSTFGTGTEDYYNYSWSSPDIFDFPYCGQPRNDGPGNRGFVANFRWHILDNLPFQDAIRFYIELYSHEPTPGFSYARTSYLYARPGLTDDHVAIKPDDLRPLEMPDGWEPAARYGAFKASFFSAEKILDAQVDWQLASGRIWEKGQSIIWSPKKVGESADFKIPVPEEGRYKIHFVARLSLDSGRIKVLLDGNPVKVGQDFEVDLYRSSRTLSRNFTITPDQQLTSGVHKITLKYSGPGPNPSDSTVGIDFFWIQPGRE